MKLFYKKVSTLNLTLWARSAEKKLGKQRSAFPGRRRSEKVASPGLGCELVAALSVTAAAVPAPPRGEPSLASPCGGRWCPVGTVQRLVSAAASVGDGRSPLGCITRAGRRECPRRGRRGLLQQPTPRTCAGLLMSTSEASCHRREWRAQALGRESPGVQPPGSFCLVKGKSEVFFRDFSLFAGESGCFLQNPRAVL